jgi:hypothetical protein
MRNLVCLDRARGGSVHEVMGPCIWGSGWNSLVWGALQNLSFSYNQSRQNICTLTVGIVPRKRNRGPLPRAKDT